MAAPAIVATSVSQCLRALVIAAGLCACAAHAQELPPPAYQLAAQRAGIPSTVLLKEQHTTGEDWLLAIGRYHRPAGGEPAARYRRSVSRHLARVQGTHPTTAALAARQETSP